MAKPQQKEVLQRKRYIALSTIMITISLGSAFLGAIGAIFDRMNLFFFFALALGFIGTFVVQKIDQ